MVGILYHKRVRSGAGQHGKSIKQLERIFKGVAHHYRLSILFLLAATPGLTVDAISQQLSIGYMNTSDHLRKLHLGGLVAKKTRGVNVEHRLTKRSEDILLFCKKLE